ncbi:hypothetical protein [Nonomuraea sp. NPDC050202]|uniref:hypothetical protein n=1 Tax=Nonomuraea sp. NPDC050202 TaxID=3155035 RepID=UPI0033EBE0B2
MADEPTLGELWRRLDGVMAMLAQLVQRTEYLADQRLSERRFAELERDVEEVRRALDNAVIRLEAADEKREEKRGSNLRQIIYSGLLPTVFILLTIAVQVWLAPRGGS